MKLKTIYNDIKHHKQCKKREKKKQNTTKQ